MDHACPDCGDACDCMWGNDPETFNEDCVCCYGADEESED